MSHGSSWIVLQADTLTPALEELLACKGDTLLDFSAVPRIDAGAVRMLDALTDHATGLGFKVVVRGIRLELHRVLKLLGVASRLTFPAAPQAGVPAEKQRNA